MRARTGSMWDAPSTLRAEDRVVAAQVRTIIRTRSLPHISSAFLAAAFMKHDLTRSLPSIHIGATLYARMQWDRRRQNKEEDFLDFAHAEAALPYCSPFATEGRLAAMLREAELDATYDCALLTDASAIQNWLAMGMSPNAGFQFYPFYQRVRRRMTHLIPDC